MPSCSDCGQGTAWDDDLGSLVCTACGTLVDPTCSVLASHLDNQDNSARQYDHLWHPTPSGTLKNPSNGRNWDLAGQGREARDRKNRSAIHEYIRSLASSLSDPAAAPRAISLFSQAMTVANYRWGRKAKLVAAASVAIARRESRRPDSILAIASIIDEPPSVVSRTFSSLVALLDLSLPITDPASHFPTLRSHLTDILHSPQPSSPLPKALRNFLIPLPLQSVMATANALSEHLSDLGDAHPLSNLPTLPTASAILLLSLESEGRSSLPNIGDLAHRFATHHGLAKSVVMSRYKIISDLIEESVKELPWLDQLQTKNGRSQMSRRVIVARGLKDVIRFRAEIRAKKLEPSEGHFDVSPNGSIMAETPRKRRKTSKYLRDATHFLLNPSSAPLPSPIDASSASSNSQPPPHISLTSYLLTTPQPSDSLNKVPTRLQRLVAERGEQAIMDDELFDDPEWEAIFRSDREIEVFREAVGWERGEVGESGDESPALNPSSQRRPKDERPSGSKKINQEVLSRLLRHQGTFGEDDSDWIGGIGQFAFSDEDDNSHEEEPTSDRHSGDGSGKISGIHSNRSATRGQNIVPAT